MKANKFYTHNGVKMTANQWAKTYIARIAEKHRADILPVLAKYDEEAAEAILEEFDYITAIVSARRNAKIMSQEQEQILMRVRIAREEVKEWNGRK